MDKNDFLQIFLEEGGDLLSQLSEHLMSLEKEPNDSTIIKEIFRIAHTLKGSSTTLHNSILESDPDEATLVNIDNMGKLTHALEDLLSEVRENRLALTENLIDLLFRAESVLEELLVCIEGKIEDEYDIEFIRQSLMEAVSQKKTVRESEQRTKPFSSERSGVRAYFKFSIECDEESFQNAYLQMVYRDIERHYSDLEFTPTSEELMGDANYDSAVVSVGEDAPPAEIVEYIRTREYVSGVIHLADGPDGAQTDDMNKETDVSEAESAPTEPHEIAEAHEPSKKDKTPLSAATLKVAVSRIDEVLKHVSNLVISKNKLLNLASESGGELSKLLKDTAEEISTSVEFLQESVMQIRMTPLDQLFGSFPKDVRNIAKKFNKKVSFKSFGGETEIDKSLLDDLRTPLMHLIRNSVFHGIESEEERADAGKNPIGNITLTAKHEQSWVVITVEDDGKGMSVEKIVKKAIEKGVITEDKAKATSEKELLNLAFHPGLSTAETVNAEAGRGVGMDVVKSTIEDMKGHVDIESTVGKGTKIVMRLPLTLAIINAMLSKIDGDVFSFPSAQVDCVVDVEMREIKYVANKEIYILRELEVPIIRLRKYFGLPSAEAEEDTLNVVILKSGSKTIGVTVDEVIGHQDIVLTHVGKYLGNVRGIGGCNVLPNGDIGLVVDINDLFNKQ